MNENALWLVLLLVGGITLTIVVVGVILTVATLLPLGLIGRHLHRRSKQAAAMRQASQSWPSTSGRVIKSRVEVRGGDHTSVDSRVIYEYNISGQVYQGQQIRAGDSFFSVHTSQDAYRTIDQYPEGASVTVYYNPDNPAEAALER